jgi:branched-chain amino acid transport system permease protein
MLENRLQRRHPLIQFVLDNWIYVVIALVIWRFPYWLSSYYDQKITDLAPRDLRGNDAINLMAVAIELYILALLAMSYNLLFGFTGIISFGHALFFGTAAYIMVILVHDHAFTALNATGVALAVGALLSLLTALAIFRIRGVYFAMFTLALAQIFFELSRVNMFRDLTNGDDGLRFTTETMPSIALSINRLELYNLTALLMVITFVLIRRLMNSPTGRVLIAIRDNEVRAQTLGYNVVRYKTLVIMLACMLASLAGSLYALLAKGVEPGALSTARTVDPLVMTIIGGIGTNPGPVIGAAVLHLGEHFFRKPDLQVDLNFILFRYRAEINTTAEWNLALGAVFILIVLAVPYGVVGEMNKYWLQIRRWGRKFIYDPLLRRWPKGANYLEPITGEAPAVALYLAQQSHNAKLGAWAMEYPFAAIISTCSLIALGGGLLTWNIQTTFSLLLFFALITAPLMALIWVYRSRDSLREQIETIRSRGFWG